MTRFRAALSAAALLTVAISAVHVPLLAAPAESATEKAWRENNIGVALMEQFDPGRATEAFRRAVALDPKLTVARVNLAIAHLYAPDLPSARKEAEQALTEAPSMPQVHYILALVARLENRPQDAERSLRATLAIDSRDPGANITLGQVLIDQERYADAIPFLEAAVATEPHNASAWYNLAMAMGRGGRMDEGRTMMTRFQEIRKSPGHVTLGKGYMEQGRYAEAVVSTGLEPGLVAPGVPAVHLVDRTTTIVGKASPPVPVTGIHLADMNADGRLDVLLATPEGLRLLLNTTAGLEDCSAAWGLPALPTAAAVAADVDNDTRPDVVILGRDRILVLHNEGARLTDVSLKAALPAPPARSSALALVDFDHDGDLDIFVPGLLLRNNGDGTYLDLTKEAGLLGSAGALAVAPVDFDNRRDVDLLTISKEKARLFQNNRDSSFTEVAAERGLSVTGRLSALATGDVNKDGSPDFVIGRPTAPAILAESDGRGRYSLRPLPEATAGAHALLLVDYDMDGILDIVAAGPLGLRIVRNAGESFVDATGTAVPEALRSKGSEGQRLAAGDIDGDGRPDLIVAGPSGLVTLRNEGGTPNRSFTVRVAGRVSNRGAVGSKVELRAGSLRQKAETSATSPAVTPADLVFGLGTRQAPDVVRVLWISGILQAELVDPSQLPAGRAALDVAELDRKPSSCPYLYAWNGERFLFITDFLGAGEMGYWLAPGLRNTPDPEEYVRIRGDQLVPRDGRLELRVTNELEEVLYLDHFRLMALDHPRGTEVFPDEGMTETPKPFRLYGLRDIRPVPRATAADGSDVTTHLARLDHSFAKGLPLLDVRGYAEPHSLTLDLSGLPESHTLLVLTGWTDYSFSSDNVAASQQGLVHQVPALEVETDEGQWETALPDIGVPVGRPQSIVVDLASAWKGTSRRVRLSTSMRIYWDSVAVGAPASLADIRTVELHPAAAVLRDRGFSKETSPDGLEPWSYDYHTVSQLSPWKTAAGRYTRTGDVLPLLRGSDDEFVVSKPGDEIALSFDASGLRPLPDGWARTYVLLSSGYSKELDINSSSPDVVMPLPYRDMPSYPYDVATAPDHVQMRTERALAWNTRYVSRSVEPIDIALARR